MPTSLLYEGYLVSLMSFFVYNCKRYAYEIFMKLSTGLSKLNDESG